MLCTFIPGPTRSINIVGHLDFPVVQFTDACHSSGFHGLYLFSRIGRSSFTTSQSNDATFVFSENLPACESEHCTQYLRRTLPASSILPLSRLDDMFDLQHRLCGFWCECWNWASEDLDQSFRIPQLASHTSLLDLNSIWSRIFRFTLQTIASAYAYSTAEGDLPACLAVSWFIWAVFVHQTEAKSPFVHWCALGAAILSLCWLMRSAIGLELKIRNRSANNVRFGFGPNDHHEGSRLLGH